MLSRWSVSAESPGPAGGTATASTETRPPVFRWLGQGQHLVALGPTLMAIGVLAWSNPGPKDFSTFAGDHLADLLTREICRSTAVPLMVNLLAGDCSSLLAAQQEALASLAAARSERLNLGLFSVYRTQLGGQRLFGHWHLPTYSVVTLAAAGQFVVLQTATDPAGPADHGPR